MERKNENIYLKIFINILIYALVILFVFLLAPELLRFFLPFILAWVIAWIANPLVQFLEERLKIVRNYSSVLIIFLVIGIIALFLYLLGRFIFVQVSMLVNDFPNIVALVSDTFDQVDANLTEILSGLPQQVIQDPLYQFGENLRASLNAFIANARLPEATLGFTRNLGDYLLFIITMFITAYFFIKDREKILGKIRGKTPDSILEKFELIKNQFNYALSGYVKAQFKIMAVVVIILYIGLKIIGTHFAFLIALLTGFIDILPIFGTGFVLWPWALVELILGNYFDATVIIALYVICQLIKNIIQPKLVGDSVGLNPLTTLVFMYTGYHLAGLVGLILSIPAGLILMNLYKVGMFDNITRGFKILFHDINEFRKF